MKTEVMRKVMPGSDLYLQNLCTFFLRTTGTGEHTTELLFIIEQLQEGKENPVLCLALDEDSRRKKLQILALVHCCRELLAIGPA